VEVTASHLPPDRNGLKLFARRVGDSDTEPSGLGEAEVDDLMVLATKLYNDQMGAYPNLDLPTTRPHPTWRARHDFLPDVYGAHLANLIRGGGGEGKDPQPLNGMRIVVNPGHGAGGFFLGVLASCGADTSGSFNVNPDGNFPGGNPNPENAANMQATVAAVAAQGADLGIIFVRGYLSGLFVAGLWR
jgi:phosphomannomutase